MHVVAFTKSTPDTAAKVEVDARGAVSWGNAALIVNPWDEYSITEAVLIKASHKAKTSVITIGADQHTDALKWALAVGLDEAYRVWDDSMANQDSLGYAVAAAAAIRKLGDVSLVIFGRDYIDVATDAHIYQTGRKLGWPVIGSVSKVTALDFGAKTITVERMVEEGKEIITSSLPAVISVLKDINEPKSPSLIGIRKSQRASIAVWSSTDLGIGTAASGDSARTTTTEYRNLPARTGSVQIIEGASEREKAEKLAEALLAEKVI